MCSRERVPSWLPGLLNGSALYPHLQPIVSLTDGRTYGYESLLRGRGGRSRAQRR